MLMTDGRILVLVDECYYNQVVVNQLGRTSGKQKKFWFVFSGYISVLRLLECENGSEGKVIC